MHPLSFNEILLLCIKSSQLSIIQTFVRIQPLLFFFFIQDCTRAFQQLIFLLFTWLLYPGVSGL